MNLDQLTIYVRHQAEAEPDEDKRTAYRRTLDYLESFDHYPGTRQQVKKALGEWISQSSRTVRRVQGDAADTLLAKMLIYAHVRDVLNGHVAVTVPNEAEHAAEAQLSFWDKGSGEI